MLRGPWGAPAPARHPHNVRCPLFCVVCFAASSAARPLFRGTPVRLLPPRRGFCNAIGNVVVSVWPWAARPGECWGWPRTAPLCCNHVHPLNRRSLLFAIPCAAGAAHGLGLLQRTGVTGIRIFIWPRTWGHRASSTRRPRATAPPQGKWQVWVAASALETMRGLWCPPCACVSRCGQPPPLSGSQDPLYLRSPLRLWLPSEVLRKRVVADGPGCTRHQLRRAIASLVDPVNTSVAPAPTRSPRACRCEREPLRGINVDGCTRNLLMGILGTFHAPSTR